MALVLADRVQQTGTANTTVSFTLSGSVTGFQSFSVVGDTNTTYYSATDASGNWEVGIGTYSTTGPTLTRTTIISSSNSNSAVTFSGTVSVILTYPSGKSVNQDASGNVGIGTSSPANSKLDVAGRGRFLQDAAATTGAVILRQNSGDTVGGHIQWVNNDNSVQKGYLAVDTSSNMVFATVATERMRIDSSGNVLPSANATYNLGSTSLRWANVYTSDLHLNNGIGNYTIVEGEEDLFLYNNKNGKTYKFALIEVDPSTAPAKMKE
jgi:hypothetical protein